MINRAVVEGRLARDVYVGNGNKVANFTIASDQNFRNRKDNKVHADFVDVTMFGRQSRNGGQNNYNVINLSKYTHKGSLISVEGHLTNHSYTNNQGQTIYTLEFIADNFNLLGSNNSNNNSGNGNGNYQNSNYPNNNGSITHGTRQQNKVPNPFATPSNNNNQSNNNQGGQTNNTQQPQAKTTEQSAKKDPFGTQKTIDTADSSSTKDSNNQSGSTKPSGNQGFPPAHKKIDISDDDLPF